MDRFEDYLEEKAGINLPAFCVDSLENANWAISKIARAEANIAQRKAAADAYRARLEEWLAKANKADIETVERIGSLLRPWADVEIAKGKAKHIKLLGGTVGYRSSPAHLEIIDQAAAIAAVPEDCKRVKVEIDKNAVKKLIESKGEIPAGVELVPGKINWYIEVEDGLPPLPQGDL